jgi:hypothetical protein
MHSLDEIGRRFGRGIPGDEQGSTQNALMAYHDSRLMLEMYSRALDAINLRDDSREPTPSVVAFGSFGRLDGSVQMSDYDMMFLYPGAMDAKTTTAIEAAIAELISYNKSFPCDHRAEIEAGTFDFGESLAYPILSEAELWANEAESRALQIITEARVVRGHAWMGEQVSGLLSDCYGYAGGQYSLDLAPLRDGLARLKTSYCTEVYPRLIEERRPLTNRKILKLFALREFHYLATLLAVAESAIAVGAHADGDAVGRARRLLGAPSFLKVASFADPAGTLGCAVPSGGSLGEQCAKCLAQHTEKLSRPDLGIALPSSSPIDSIRALVLSVLRPYDRLLGLLHDSAFVQLIDEYKPYVTNWMIDPRLRQIGADRDALVDNTKHLARALLDVIAILSQEMGCRALEEAKATLEVVEAYSLEIAAPTS